MSHNVTLTGVKITDIKLFGKIAEKLSEGKAVLDTSGKTFRTYAGQPNKCDALIRMPGWHDIGLVKNKDGSYVPVFDPYKMDNVFMHRHGSNIIGKLLQEYTLQMAEYEAAQNGMTATRISGKNDTVTLELVKAS